MKLDPPAIERAFSRAASHYAEHAFLQREVESRLLERVHALKPQAECILDIGAGDGFGALALRRLYPKAQIIAADLSAQMCLAAKKKCSWWRPHRVVRASMDALPFADGGFDLVYSSLALQWSQDLPNTAHELRRVLAPGGRLLLTTLGPDTLKELRAAWAEVDQGAHVHVFIDMHDVGDALLRAGFKDPVMDVERITLQYTDARRLMRDLKGIGAHNAHAERRRSLTGKRQFTSMLSAYETHRRDGLLPASYEIVYAQALGPEPGQPIKEGGQSVARIPVGAIRRIKR